MQGLLERVRWRNVGRLALLVAAAAFLAAGPGSCASEPEALPLEVQPVAPPVPREKAGRREGKKAEEKARRREGRPAPEPKRLPPAPTRPAPQPPAPPAAPAPAPVVPAAPTPPPQPEFF
jgi:hypothetical protein